MLPEILLGLAAAGGTALVGAMATDAWESTRKGVAALLGRGDGDKAEEVERELDRDAKRLLAARGDADVRRELESGWSRRLAEHLAGNPDAAEALRAQLLPTAQQVTMTNNAFSGSVQNNMQNGSQHITVNQAGR